MEKNVGNLDQTIRYIVAIVFVLLAVFTSFSWRWIFLVFAAVLAFTAAISWCGLYRVFGIRTCPIKQDD